MVLKGYGSLYGGRISVHLYAPAVSSTPNRVTEIVVVDRKTKLHIASYVILHITAERVSTFHQRRYPLETASLLSYCNPSPGLPIPKTPVRVPLSYLYSCPPLEGKLKPKLGTCGGVATDTGSGRMYPYASMAIGAPPCIPPPPPPIAPP